MSGIYMVRMLMWRLFDAGDYPTTVNIGLLLNRLAIGALMVGHGWGKLVRLFGPGEISFADPLGLGQTVSLLLTVFAEVFCSILLILGLGTRLAVIPLIISMTVVVLVIHADDPFGRKELALLYLVSYFMIAFVGAGSFSLDKFICRKTGRLRPTPPGM